MSEVLQHEFGDAMSGVLQHESSFDVRGVRYRYLIWTGACRSLPPVILLHGFSQSADSWDQVAPLLVTARYMRLTWLDMADQPLLRIRFPMRCKLRGRLCFRLPRTRRRKTAGAALR